MGNLSISLQVKQYPKEGYLQHTYSPLRNLTNNGKIEDFNIDAKRLNYFLNPVFITCQPSYDGTVNLILNDDINPPRLINTRFSKTESGRFKVINRNQKLQSNLYNQDYIDSSTRLVKNVNAFPVIDLLSVNDSGNMKGGNYTFYIKYIDGDFNETPIVAESGQVCIFHGSSPEDSSGTLSDELTAKSIKLRISNLDTSYNAFILYYVRSYSDTSGTKMVEAKMLDEEYVFTSQTFDLELVGYESVSDYTTEELNVHYLSIDSVKTQTQVQNMLFFGNLTKNITNESDLQNLAYFIEVRLRQGDSIGYVNSDYSYEVDSEYYNPQNIYYKLGYWPDEYYKLGVVFLMNDDSTTPVFPLRGCSFQKVWDDNKQEYENTGDGASNLFELFGVETAYKDGLVLEKNEWLSNDFHRINTFGVFKNPKDDDKPIINCENKEVKPYYYEIIVPEIVSSKLSEFGVKGCFFVRQRRIPTIFGQGVSFGVDRTGYAPMIYTNKRYVIEGFLTQGDGGKTKNVDYGKNFAYQPMLKLDSDYNKSLIYASWGEMQSSCLVSVDADISPSLQSMLNGTNFVIEGFKAGVISSRGRHFQHSITGSNNATFKPRAVYVSEGTPYKFVGDFGFSTKFGNSEEVKNISFVGKPIRNNTTDEVGDLGGATVNPDDVYKSSSVYGGRNLNIVRGVYTGVIGLDKKLSDGDLYNIRVPGYEGLKEVDYFEVRKNDLSPYYAITNRIKINNSKVSTDAFRGDCFANTVTVRLLKNFVDPDATIADTIIDRYTWGKNYAGYMQMGGEPNDEKPTGDWSQINRSDVNNVPLGMWFTYKCLSSNNLGLRAVDHSYPDEEALMGVPRSFYPLSGMSIKSANKVSDSKLLNSGYSNTVGHLYNIPAKDLPYQKELFDNRIAFSNIQVEDEFKNGYRVFQSLAYKDVDRQYGAIVKLLPWETDLLCVFEHGIGIVPVNQKALMQTTTGQSIHMYGAGVLQSQISLITGDYGSVWQESIIQTPVGVYGVDTYAKKIWRYSQQKGFETISDMVVQRFLNDNILLDEHTDSSIIALRNVKTHYNNYKGDVMFTFYNNSKNCEWNLCYNERLGKWTTRYSWIPLYSENINNIYYSFDKKRSSILSSFNNLLTDSYGIKLSEVGSLYGSHKFVLSGTELDTKFTIRPIRAYTSYLDDNNCEKELEIPLDAINYSYIANTEQTIKINDSYIESWWKQLFVSKEISEEVVVKKLGDNEDVIYTTTKTDFKALDDNGNQLTDSDGNWLYCETETELRISYEYNPPTQLPLWIGIDVNVNCHYGNASENAIGVDRKYTITLIDFDHNDDKEMYDRMFTNGVYVHGRAGIFDEIDYTDDSLDNQILPTKWYDKQEPFEFEFVVNDPTGIHKVFENLTIISNNVAPESIQFEIEGDVYSMWKTGIGNANPTYSKGLKKEQYKNNTLFKNASVKWDTILNQYSILMTQECKSIEKFGRRLGNIHYKEDSWYITINPLLLNKNGKTKSTKLRDKYLKVRVRYSGEDLAVITAIKSMVNLSAS